MSCSKAKPVRFSCFRHLALRLLLLAVIALPLVHGCDFVTDKYRKIEQVRVVVEQRDKLIKPVDGVVELNREQFSFIIDLPEQTGVLVNASYADSVFRQPSAEKFQEIFTDNRVMAVDLFNQEASLFLAATSSNAWYHLSEDEHTCNKVVKKTGGHSCTLVIKHLIDADSGVDSALGGDSKPVYLVFAAVDLREEVSVATILVDQSLKIEWRD